MGAGRKTITIPLKEKSTTSWSVNCSAPARNMRKSDLGAVIFGCKHSTIKECLFKQLFGLPAPHFSYVKNITPGLVLFLFNYSERKLYGIYEAVGPGQLNINPYAWTTNGTELTSYPAQVQIRVRRQCEPLTEEQFGPVIASNYFENRLFWFELDRDQTNHLISLFSPASGSTSLTSSHNTAKWNSLFRPLPTPDRKQSSDEEPKDGNPNQVGVYQSAWDDSYHFSKAINLLESSTGNLKANSQPSYSSVLCNAKLQQTDDKNVKLAQEASPAHPNQVMNWSALFKPPAASKETKNDEKSNVQENESDMEWASVLPCTDYESRHSLEDQGDEMAARNYDKECVNMEQEQPYMNVIDHLQENKGWGSSASSSHLDGQTQSSEVSLDELDLTETPYHEIDLTDYSTMRNKTTSEMNHQRDTSLPLSTAGPHIEEKCSPIAEMVPRMMSSDLESLVIKLLQEIDGLKESQLQEARRVNSLEQQLIESKLEIQQLKIKYNMLQCGPYSPTEHAQVHGQSRKPQPQIDDSVLIVGGFNGSSWLLSLDSYKPSHDTMKSLSPMTFSRSYSSAAKLNGELYLLGGGDDGIWHDTVESYNLTSNKWVTRPSLNQKKGSLAGASLRDKIFAIGGGNGLECFSDVEMLDLNIGRWISIKSMEHKRFSSAAAELNGALYVVGGYDGRNYLKSVERLDPREHAWTGLGSMNISRGCHSLAVLNEKLYALGGYNGGNMVPTVEVFDPRVGSWIVGEPMNVSRANCGAFVMGGKIYVAGGMYTSSDICETVECYREGYGWEMTNLKGIGKRCFFSAMVL